VIFVVCMNLWRNLNCRELNFVLKLVDFISAFFFSEFASNQNILLTENLN
jgi:hypothetical protein